MMEQCHLCFKVRRLSEEWDAEWAYVAPEFLQPWGLEHDSRYSLYLQTPPTATVTAGYTFLHTGIVRSFLTQIGHRSGDTAEFWKDGCHFYEETSGCNAMVRCWPGRRGESENAGTIHIRAWGTNARSLVEPLVEALDQMPIGQRPAVQWSDGESPKPRYDPDPEGLQKLRITLEKKVFLSYRHGDSKELVRRLAAVLAKRGWTVVWDEDGLQLGESISAFVDQARVTPFLMPVFSRTYHESRWCLSELFGFCE
jgi:internalin A